MSLISLKCRAVLPRHSVLENADKVIGQSVRSCDSEIRKGQLNLIGALSDGPMGDGRVRNVKFRPTQITSPGSDVAY
jgi:hypothetical protein